MGSYLANERLLSMDATTVAALSLEHLGASLKHAVTYLRPRQEIVPLRYDRLDLDLKPTHISWLHHSGRCDRAS
jgi:hypothetical protein